MKILPSIESLELTKRISDSINNQTFHHHYHILYDIAKVFENEINYVEIGCYAGGSACLLLQRPKTNAISIDCGHPISQSVVVNNVKNLNIYNNCYNYIQGYSQQSHVKTELKNILKNNLIDILFIDGGHKYDEVIDDFNLYNELVNHNGYIVFDDYNDEKYCPEVKLAVDEIISKLSDYEIIGTFKNDLKARPEELLEGNCFIIKKI
jgi:predicted O-methyltransferase YrrM